MAAALAGCTGTHPRLWAPPQYGRASAADQALLDLPPPGNRVSVAVYSFTDQTGQFKNSDSMQTLARAVTQGGTSVLIKSLQDVGKRQWFEAVEREHLDDLLRERAIIRDMRQAYLGEKQLNPQALPALHFAGVLLEGGVIGYDANVRTGGLGAQFLGIGANSKYQEDTVTVYLRAVSTKTGEVLISVNARKSVSSILLASSTYRYVGYQDLLAVDAGYTENEPVQIALQQAIAKAVYGLVLEGAEQRLWCFAAPVETAQVLLIHHIAERDHIKLKDVRLPVDPAGKSVTGACSTAPQLSMAMPGQPGRGPVPASSRLTDRLTPFDPARPEKTAGE